MTETAAGTVGEKLATTPAGEATSVSLEKAWKLFKEVRKSLDKTGSAFIEIANLEKELEAGFEAFKAGIRTSRNLEKDAAAFTSSMRELLGILHEKVEDAENILGQAYDVDDACDSLKCFGEEKDGETAEAKKAATKESAAQRTQEMARLLEVWVLDVPDVRIRGRIERLIRLIANGETDTRKLEIMMPF